MRLATPSIGQLAMLSVALSLNHGMRGPRRGRARAPRFLTE